MLVLTTGPNAAAGPDTRANALRAQENALTARLQSETVDLYALDAKLSSARATLAQLRTQSSQLRFRERRLAQQIAATQRTLRMSQARLGTSLRLRYEQGAPDPLAVILGAESFDQAVSTIDGLERVTDQSNRLVLASLSARSRLRILRAELSAHRARIAAAVRTARATARTLASARDARVTFIAGLQSQQRLKASQIQELEAAVQRARAKSNALTADAAARGPVPAAVGVPGAGPAPDPSGHTLVVSATAYSLPGRTATGLPVGWGIVAVDPTVIPLGTRMTIPGYGEGVAADVGSGIRGAMIDLWFPTVAQADAWGRRTVTITLH